MSPKAALESEEEEKDSPTPSRVRRRFEKRSSFGKLFQEEECTKKNLKAGTKMKLPGRRTTTFGFGDIDLDESNESEGEPFSPLFTPSPKKRESRSAKRQKFSSEAENSQASSSSQRFWVLLADLRTIRSTSPIAFSQGSR